MTHRGQIDSVGQFLLLHYSGKLFCVGDMKLLLLYTEPRQRQKASELLCEYYTFNNL